MDNKNMSHSRSSSRLRKGFKSEKELLNSSKETDLSKIPKDQQHIYSIDIGDDASHSVFVGKLLNNKVHS